MAAPAALVRMREIQAWQYPSPTPGATAPDYCLAASRFLTGKLAGLFPSESHLNQFLASPYAKGLPYPAKAWGRLDFDFNGAVLPAAIRWGGKRRIPPDIEFVRGSNPGEADGFLKNKVPLVVGVSLHGKGQRDHFITLVLRGGTVWAIDSWGDDVDGGVVEVRNWTTFMKPVVVPNANAGETTITCKSPFFGWYRDKSIGKGGELTVVDSVFN
jgi:hypothetical protein